MAASTAITGFGVLLKRGDGGGTEAFTAISELKRVNGPGWSMDVVDITHTASPSQFKEFAAALRDGGEIQCTCAFLMDGTQDLSTGILKDLQDGTKRNFKLVWPFTVTKTASFAALVTGFSPTADIGQEMLVEIKLKISGPITIS